MAIFGKKGASAEKGWQNNASNSGYDQSTTDWINQIRQATQAAANNPGAAAVNPMTTRAANHFAGMLPGANLGWAALGGDANAARKLMNPYEDQVVSRVNSEWDRAGTTAMNQVADQATRAGAFGGSRAAVAQGGALGAVQRDRMNQIAGIRQQGFGEAMGRAGQMVNFGMGAGDRTAAAGDYMRNAAMESDPNMWRMNTLMRGFLPTGQFQRSSGSNTKVGTSASIGF